VGFVSYNWLLGHVSTSQASTYAYVNPVVAFLVGWLLNDHGISVAIICGMGLILTGVALVSLVRNHPVDQGLVHAPEL
jgi:drug/metabolite transporter (DMT)-like permease